MEEEQEQPLRGRQWYSNRSVLSSKTFFATTLLILVLGTTAIVYMSYKINKIENAIDIKNQEMDFDTPDIDSDNDDVADDIRTKSGSSYDSEYQRSKSPYRYNDRSSTYEKNPYYRYRPNPPRHVFTSTGSIKVGILHSKTGTIAISESILIDLLLLLIKQQNQKGGLLGKKLKPVVVDPASNDTLFAELAEQLIVKRKVSVVFGCWTSTSRIAVRPVFKKYNSILFYSTQFEGQESDRNIFYTGASPNQQAIQAVDYLMGLGVERWILEGTDYIYPRTTNAILKAYLKQKGVSTNDIRENYTPFSFTDWAAEVTLIKAFGSTGKKTAIISTINGDSNVAFYTELTNQGISSANIPFMAFSVSENELTQIPADTLSGIVGNYASWNYFQSIDTPINEEFIKQWQQYTGHDNVTNDPMEATYIAFNMWIKAVTGAQTTDADTVIDRMVGVAVPNLSGDYASMLANHYITKPVYIGSITDNGQFDVVYQTPGLLAGDAWSDYLPFSAPLISDWRKPLACGEFNTTNDKCEDP
ncbi:unnamed protein product [Adineta steineri]|uniref:Uncharacterized protein n=2 Tax=Adineta steineri TaxID=433720 RepID=A0A818T1I4_9BILA|nr:unnamed protein product [Adineta steineri]